MNRQESRRLERC